MIRYIVLGEGLRQPNDKVQRIWHNVSVADDIYCYVQYLIYELILINTIVINMHVK